MSPRAPLLLARLTVVFDRFFYSIILVFLKITMVLSLKGVFTSSFYSDSYLTSISFYFSLDLSFSVFTFTLKPVLLHDQWITSRAWKSLRQYDIWAQCGKYCYALLIRWFFSLSRYDSCGTNPFYMPNQNTFLCGSSSSGTLTPSNRGKGDKQRSGHNPLLHNQRRTPSTPNWDRPKSPKTYYWLVAVIGWFAPEILPIVSINAQSLIMFC